MTGVAGNLEVERLELDLAGADVHNCPACWAGALQEIGGSGPNPADAKVRDHEGDGTAAKRRDENAR